MIQQILAIETSCDDTSVAIVNADGYVLSLVSANQDLAHAPYGGIVPEIASRNHTIHLLPLIDKAIENSKLSWSQIQGIAVTNRPGLIGSLIVGVVTAKTLSQVHKLPMIGVNHLEGHIVAPLLKDKSYCPALNFKFPYLSLAVSGGHTSIYLIHDFGDYEILGSSVDDAAGEAFDKFAKMLGMDFPGGVKVDQLSQNGNPHAYEFPRSMIKEDNFMMSFSGLKSSAQRLIAGFSSEDIEKHKSDLCASFQEAIVDVLLAKLEKAVNKTQIKQVAITGGVSANSRLRSRAQDWAFKNEIVLQVPPIRYCTDNAAMIGLAGIWRLNQGQQHDLKLGPSPQPWPGDFR